MRMIILEKLAHLDTLCDRESTDDRMEILKEIKERDLEKMIPEILNVLENLIERVDLADANESDYIPLIKEAIGILVHIVQTYLHFKEHDTSTYTKHREVYKKLPELLKEHGGIDPIIRVLNIDNRLIRHQIINSILPPLVDQFYETLVPLRKSRKIGGFIDDVLRIARTQLRTRERAGKNMSQREKAALRMIDQHVSD
jgi:hypothetical protein